MNKIKLFMIMTFGLITSGLIGMTSDGTRATVKVVNESGKSVDVKLGVVKKDIEGELKLNFEDDKNDYLFLKPSINISNKQSMNFFSTKEYKKRSVGIMVDGEIYKVPVEGRRADFFNLSDGHIITISIGKDKTISIIDQLKNDYYSRQAKESKDLSKEEAKLGIERSSREESIKELRRSRSAERVKRSESPSPDRVESKVEPLCSKQKKLYIVNFTKDTDLNNDAELKIARGILDSIAKKRTALDVNGEYLAYIEWKKKPIFFDQSAKLNFILKYKDKIFMPDFDVLVQQKKFLDVNITKRGPIKEESIDENVKYRGISAINLDVKELYDLKLSKYNLPSFSMPIVVENDNQYIVIIVVDIKEYEVQTIKFDNFKKLCEFLQNILSQETIIKDYFGKRDNILDPIMESIGEAEKSFDQEFDKQEKEIKNDEGSDIKIKREDVEIEMKKLRNEIEALEKKLSSQVYNKTELDALARAGKLKIRDEIFEKEKDKFKDLNSQIPNLLSNELKSVLSEEANKLAGKREELAAAPEDSAHIVKVEEKKEKTIGEQIKEKENSLGLVNANLLRYKEVPKNESLESKGKRELNIKKMENRVVELTSEIAELKKKI